MKKNEVKNFIIQYTKDVIGIELSQEMKDSQKSLLEPEGGMSDGTLWEGQTAL